MAGQGFHRIMGSVAILVLGTILVSCGNPAQAEVDRANELLNNGRDAEAFDAFVAALELDPDNAEALVGRGCALLDRDIAAALADLDRAISSEPESVDGHRCRAEARRKTGDLEAALADATKAVDIDPSDPAAHVALGNTLDELRTTDEAITAYDTAIDLASKLDDSAAMRALLANAYNQRSIARGRLDDDAGAAADVEKAIELDPTYGAAYANRAASKAWGGDCPGAIVDADRAIELDPDLASAYGTRALCRADAGNLDAALADANRAIELGRVDAYAYFTRGAIHAERGDTAQATADLRNAIELAPTADFADAIRALMTDYGLE